MQVTIADSKQQKSEVGRQTVSELGSRADAGEQMEAIAPEPLLQVFMHMLHDWLDLVMVMIVGRCCMTVFQRDTRLDNSMSDYCILLFYRML